MTRDRGLLFWATLYMLQWFSKTTLN